MKEKLKLEKLRLKKQSMKTMTMPDRRARICATALALVFALSALLSLSAPAGAEVAAFPDDWRPLPIWGGDVRTVAISPADPDLVLAGTSAGQLYISRTGGGSWSNAGAPLPFPGWVVGALRFDPNRPSRLWVALWGVWGSGQVAFSDDLGKSWAARSAGLPNEQVYTLALVPGKEGKLYAATASGVWGTEDGGLAWRQLTASIEEMGKVSSLLVDASRPDTVIAGTWRRAYRSDDGGATWTGIFEGMVLDSEVFSLTPVAANPGEIWATTCGWVYHTLDRGDHWERFKDGFAERRTPSFAALPDGRLLAGTVGGLHMSVDGGKTWKPVGDPALAVQGIAVHPDRPQRVILATEGSGVWVSNDGAASFYPSSNGITNTRVSALAMSGDDLLVGVGHGGPLSGVHLSRDRGATFPDFRPLPNVLDFGVHLGRLYAATERGLFERRGADWFRLKELGEGRVEQIAVDGERIAVRTPDALWDLVGGKFVQRTYKHGPPRSAAFYGDALWVSDAKGLYRLTQEANHTVDAPFTGGRLLRLADQLLLAGPGGAFARPGPDAAWTELTGKASRLLPTGDARWSAVMVSGDTARLYDREARKFEMLQLPVPARDISAVVVANGQLFLGTSGYGVLVKRLE
jgi:photosystem II stability/assembly factor-like uncharacterized protein